MTVAVSEKCQVESGCVSVQINNRDSDLAKASILRHMLPDLIGLAGVDYENHFSVATKDDLVTVTGEVIGNLVQYAELCVDGGSRVEMRAERKGEKLRLEFRNPCRELILGPSTVERGRGLEMACMISDEQGWQIGYSEPEAGIVCFYITLTV